MDRYFTKDTQITIKQGESVLEFTIEERIGKGASSAVYRASKTVKYLEESISQKYILKEYNPTNILLERDEHGVLKAGSDKNRFESGMNDFLHGVEQQIQMRYPDSGPVNNTISVIGVYEGYGTKYIVMDCNQGKPYDTFEEVSMYGLLDHIHDLAVSVNEYHKEGYLHLDLKPSNMFLANFGDKECLLFFDFDSLVKEDKLAEATLSYTTSWAAPELLDRSKKDYIGQITDVFSIGEILFFKLFGRHSNEHERSTVSKYSFDMKANIMKNVNPAIQKELKVFFRRAICNSPRKRYKNLGEVIEALEKLKTMADPKEPYLLANVQDPVEGFVGRAKELQGIHDKLESHQMVFISGMGAIGKSEIAKMYCKRYGDEYTVMTYVPYKGSKINILNSIRLGNYKENFDISEYARLERKKEAIDEICNRGKVLLLVDNFNEKDYAALQILEELECKILITTRIEDFANHPVVKIGALDDERELLHLFANNYAGVITEENRPIILHIINKVGKHTMTIELLAKQMYYSNRTPVEMLSILENGGLKESGEEEGLIYKDKVYVEKNAYGYLKILFDHAALSKSELQIMYNLAIIPYTGISLSLFKMWSDLDNLNVVNSLVTAGWMKKEIKENEAYISLHPVIGELTADLLEEQPTSISALLDNCYLFIKQENHSNLAFVDMVHLRDVTMGIAKELMHRKFVSKPALRFLANVPSVLQDYAYLPDVILAEEYALKTKLDSGEINDIFLAFNEDASAREMTKETEVYSALIGHFSLAELYIKSWELFKSNDHLSECIRLINNGLFEKEIAGKYLAVIYLTYGTMHLNSWEYDKAAEYYLKAASNWMDENKEKYLETSRKAFCAVIKQKKYEKVTNYDYESYIIQHQTNASNLAYLEYVCILAVSYYHVGDIVKYNTFSQYVLKMKSQWDSIFGELQKARLAQKMSWMYYECEEYGNALCFANEAIFRYKDKVSKEHIDLTAMHSNLALIHCKRGRLKDAIEEYDKAKEMYWLTRGKHFYKLICVYFNLMLLYDLNQDRNKQKEMFAEIMEIQKTELVPSKISAVIEEKLDSFLNSVKGDKRNHKDALDFLITDFELLLENT